MNGAIQLRRDRKRRCGWRKPGGRYLVAEPETLGPVCGKLPVPLEVCPACGQGLRQNRVWNWVDGTALSQLPPCNRGNCDRCPLMRPIGRAGLLWVGEKQYRSPADFLGEAIEQGLGISKRLSGRRKESGVPYLPAGFVAGETWVFLAHHRAVLRPDGTLGPGAFYLFRPTRLEYVCTGEESQTFVEELLAIGITPVRVERLEDGPVKREEEITQ